MRDKYKEIEETLKSMQSFVAMVCDERPDCCDVIEVKDKWITSLTKIKETEEFKEFIVKLNNTKSDSSLEINAKYLFKLNL